VIERGKKKVFFVTRGTSATVTRGLKQRCPVKWRSGEGGRGTTEKFTLKKGGERDNSRWR